MVCFVRPTDWISERRRCLSLGRKLIEYDLPLAEISEHFDKFRVYIVTQAVIEALQVQRIQDPAAHFQLS